MKALSQRIVNLVYGIATGGKRTRLILTPLLATVFLSALILLIIISFYLDRLFGFPKLTSKTCGMVISIPLLLIGSALWIWSAWKFFRSKGTPVPVSPPPKLITDGPYAYSRNPMMTGVFIMLAGIGILFRSVSLVFIMLPIFALIAVLEFKCVEEPELEKRFGKEYAEYKGRTPIIIPRMRTRPRRRKVSVR